MTHRLQFLILLICVFGFELGAQAKDYLRSINAEWEPIENAKTYELEITSQKQKDFGVKSYKTHDAIWTGELQPGTYQMRIRARDRRNVPGDWSAPEELKVNLDPVTLKAPKSNSNFSSDEKVSASVPFEWTEVGGAKEYEIHVESEDGTVKETKTTSSTHAEINLPVAKKYRWQVVARSEQPGIGSESFTVDGFTVFGKKLEPVAIDKPESQFVRTLHWTKPEYADKYDYVISRYNSKTAKWESQDAKKDFTGEEAEFQRGWRGGKYKISMRAKGNLRENSERSDLEFTVFNGDRSPATEQTMSLRESIDRTTGWFGIASYLITQMNYVGSSEDNKSQPTSNVIGGTGRLGAGFLSPESKWGFLGIADLSGFQFDQKIYNFASIEANAVYRNITVSQGESRHQFGLFYKDLPEIQGTPKASFTGVEKISSIGPHYGYEYWYGLSPKLGMQANFHSYLSLTKVHTPNDQPIEPALTFQFGLLGSYRLSKTKTGLMGYAYRLDNLKYKAKTSGTNDVKIEGHYLNFYLEWLL